MQFKLDHILAACGFIKEGNRYIKNGMYEAPKGVKISIRKFSRTQLDIIIAIDGKELEQ